MKPRLCGYTLVDSEGEEYPCNRPVTGWRWYQDVPHEDCLDMACDYHENEGGRRMHEAALTIAYIRGIWLNDLGHATYCESLATGRGRNCNCWRATIGAIIDPEDQS